jgi:hypothetical protein
MVGVLMSVGVMTVGVMSVGEITVGDSSEIWEIEDEMHFLMSCSKYDKTRQDLFSIDGMTCIIFQNLSIEEISYIST